jgi:hypothetical protein
MLRILLVVISNESSVSLPTHPERQFPKNTGRSEQGPDATRSDPEHPLKSEASVLTLLQLAAD